MLFFFFKQKTAYEMRISDWSSDVCSSDLLRLCLGPQRLDIGVETRIAARLRMNLRRRAEQPRRQHHARKAEKTPESELLAACHRLPIGKECHGCTSLEQAMLRRSESKPRRAEGRSDEHTSELQSLMRISY